MIVIIITAALQLYVKLRRLYIQFDFLLSVTPVSSLNRYEEPNIYAKVSRSKVPLGDNVGS